MKIRNKKTGELVDAWSFYDGNESVNLKYFTNDGQVNLEYRSLAELNEEWEDYIPAEPLIKDEKIRKFVRDWATFNKIEEAFVETQYGNNAWYIIHGNDEEKFRWKIEIHASYSETINKNYDGTLIDIIELCGEEEE